MIPEPAYDQQRTSVLETQTVDTETKNSIELIELRLTTRNEGAIKSYESCRDLRAWSHDIFRRDEYLREWMKSDMTISVVPANTLIQIMKKMTYGSQGKTIPRCHPQCKSRIVLESICSSCHVMKECLRKEKDFNNFFEDEEFETSHWPCEKCLEALKTIKMFWNIIIDKLFHVKLKKSGHFEESDRTDCVRSVAKVWQTNMVRQALFVKSDGQVLDSDFFPWATNTEKYKKIFPLKSKSGSNVESKDEKCKPKSDKLTDTQSLMDSNFSKNTRRFKRLSPPLCPKLKVVTNHIGCECISLSDEINALKANFKKLQLKSHSQDTEIEKLIKENESLKAELHSLYKNMWRKSANPHTKASMIRTARSSRCCEEELPKPFEVCEANKPLGPIRPVDSEIIITMKNCKDETYRYISLLQVLHKSNEPVSSDYNRDESNCKKEDPMVLLAKVQSKFCAIVSREISLLDNSSCCSKTCKVDADYRTSEFSNSRSPSFSTITTTDTNSGADFSVVQETLSTEDRGEKKNNI